MFDNLATSADGLIVGIFLITLFAFFLFGPHKIYEAIFGALFGLGVYLLIYQMAYVFTDVTRTLWMGNWIIENRSGLLWSAKVLSVIIFLIAPVTIGLNVSGVVRGNFLYFMKLLFLSLFFVCFGVVLFSILYSGNTFFGEGAVLSGVPLDIPFLQKSAIFTWASNYAHIIILIAFVSAFYKILLSHWLGVIFLAMAAAYAKGQEVFGKKDFSIIGHEGGHDDGGHGDDHGGHDDHGHGGHDDHHH